MSRYVRISYSCCIPLAFLLQVQSQAGELMVQHQPSAAYRSIITTRWLNQLEEVSEATKESSILFTTRNEKLKDAKSCVYFIKSTGFFVLFLLRCDWHAKKLNIFNACTLMNLNISIQSWNCHYLKCHKVNQHLKKCIYFCSSMLMSISKCIIFVKCWINKTRCVGENRVGRVFWEAN